ncbi:MAG: DUF456 family protein [Phycisphaerales bacterium]|nr:DUF456 family protein [Phycisphaerales bacterium]
MAIPPGTWDILVGLGACTLAWVGVLLTAFTLPGIWFALLAAGAAQWWSIAMRPEPMFSWWTLGVCAALALTAELVEVGASAVGAAKAGGTKKGAIGSVIGAILGAIVGTFALAFLPVLGTIIGASIGAGLGALLLEKHLGEKTWQEAGKVGAGAAIGRLLATVAKVAFAAVVATVLSVAAFL